MYADLRQYLNTLKFNKGLAESFMKNNYFACESLKNISKSLVNFIEKSPDAYHTVENIKLDLVKAGFSEIFLNEKLNIAAGGKYFILKNASSLIAFILPKQDYYAHENFKFMLAATHADSPSFKLKTISEIKCDGYVKLNTERYGGMIPGSWLDRPLSVSGRVIVRTNQGIRAKLINIDKDLFVIPSVAVHMDKKSGNGSEYNYAVDFCPVFGDENSSGKFISVLADALKTNVEDIIDYDLYVYNRQQGSIWGCNDEFISSPRLDDLQCTYAAYKAFAELKPGRNIPVLAIFDNEEVGSATAQGAGSLFLSEVLKKILRTIEKEDCDYLSSVSNSFAVSADNAHAVHPNHPEYSDSKNRVFINKGIVVKYNSMQKYSTDSLSASVFKEICRKADIPLQSYHNRSDIAGGSTLGSIMSCMFPANTVDIGLAQLSMHSAYESAGVVDTAYMIKAFHEYWHTEITKNYYGGIDFVRYE